MNSTSTPLDRHKEITLLFLKHASLHATRPPEAAARALTRDVEALGSAFIRAVRSLSSRADLLSAPYLDAFAGLDERESLAMENAETLEVMEQVIEEELGKKITRAFATFDPEPIGFSASGQIHQAVLHDGRHVTLRIQRPSARQRIVKDLDALVEIAAFLDNPSGRGNCHRFSRHIDRHRLMLVRELDYRREEAALVEMRSTAARHDRIHIPVVVAEYCSPRILATETIVGTQLWEVPSPRDGRSSRELAGQFLGCVLDQMLVHGLVHPAPDMENLLLTTGGDLVMTDACGAIRIGPSSRSVLRQLLTGLCTGDTILTAEASLGVGHHSDVEKPLDRSAFLAGIREALSQEGLPARLLHVSRVAASHGLPFHPDMCRLGDLLSRLPAIADALSPRFNSDRFIAEYLNAGQDALHGRIIPFPEPSAA